MCHHRIDVTELTEERETEQERETEEEPTVADSEFDESAVDVELDRAYEERDVKTPGDD